MELRGSLPALVTPLADRDTLASDELRRLVLRAVGDGATGVLVAGSTGEGTLLGARLRQAVTREARAALGPVGTSTTSTPVLLSCASGPTVDALLRDVARLATAGADAVLVLAPAIQPLRPEELLDLHLGVADGACVPTLAYHIPQFTNAALTPDAVAELASHAGIVGMKDSSTDADRRAGFAGVAAHARSRGRDFAVLTGHAPTLLDALDAGVDGSITAIANVRQRQVVELHEAFRADDTARARQVQAALTRVDGRLAAVGASVPAVLKAALQLEGVLAERWCRPPLHSVPPSALDRVRTALLP